MEHSEHTAAAPEARPVRRVGTFTMGAVLVAGGLLMLVSMFCPQLDFTWALKLSPVILISLGVETLLASRDGSHVKYDWVGMLLCLLIVGTALVLFCIAWCLLHRPEWINF